jgi:mannose-1-phosphate guanylyltransferase/mannose-6-phosphate isomerase
LLHAVILAGGAGERFWPASRAARPKPFLRVVGGRTLLEATCLRARRVAGASRVWVVCGREHAAAIRRGTGLPASRILVEPLRRNTAAAIAFAALRIARSDPDAVLLVLPADHHIPDVAAFARDVRAAARAARAEGVLVTLGVHPTRPETGYGYIEVGPPAGRAYPRLRRVRRFVEKPDARRALRFLRGGRHLWNAGIFVFSARAILAEIEALAPALTSSLAPLAAPARPSRAQLARAYGKAPSVSIDVAVMERSARVWTLPVRWHWSDVGTWESLATELGVAPGRSRVLGGELVHDDAGGNLVWGRPGRPIALLGVTDLAVVDTGDALLVARLGCSNEVRAIVQALKAKGRPDVT